MFESDPSGATVSLIVDGKREPLGPTAPRPTSSIPRKTYQVLFEKARLLVSRSNQPHHVRGRSRGEVDRHAREGGRWVAVERPDRAQDSNRSRAERKPKTSPSGLTGDETQVPVTRPDKGEPKTEAKTGRRREPKTEPKTKPGSGQRADARRRRRGHPLLGAKPPCDIYIDGKSTGLKTPQRDIKLSAGHHKVTLMNNEFSIKESFTVEIKAGTPTKMVKDFSDRIPQQ